MMTIVIIGLLVWVSAGLISSLIAAWQDEELELKTLLISVLFGPVCLFTVVVFLINEYNLMIWKKKK